MLCVPSIPRIHRKGQKVMPGINGWTKKGDAKEQARFDRLKGNQAKSEDDRHTHNAMHRGLSGHPASENNRRGFTEMSDRELRAHGMIRVRGLFGTTYRTMETHQDKVEEAREERYAKSQARKAAAADRAAQRKAQRKASSFWSLSAKPKPKKKGFFSW